MNKCIHLGLSKLKISKFVIYEFWYDYVKPKRFIVHVKTEDIYKVIAKDVEKRLDTSNYELEIPLPKEKTKKVIGLMNNELGGKTMEEFVRSRAKHLAI